MWLLPLLIVGTVVLLSLPLGWYLARVLDSPTRLPGVLRWLETRIDTGPQTWNRYVTAMPPFNAAAFLAGLPSPALPHALLPYRWRPGGPGLGRRS
mgnify:CR=1 FL=1